MVTAEIHRGRVIPDALKKDWDRLMDRGRSEPSVSWEWTAALFTSHVRETDEVVFIILKRFTTVIGIVPVILRPLKYLGQTFITAFPASELFNTHSDLLIEDVSEPVLTAMTDALYGSELRWDVFRVTRLLEARPLGALWCAILRKRWTLLTFTREQPSFFLSLDGTFEAYLKRRSASFRNALRRIERKLRTRGRVEIRNQDNFSTIDEAYEVLLSIEQRSWKQGHGTSIAALSRHTAFYRHLCASAFQKQWLHLRFLYLDGDPIAYNLGLLVKDTYFYLKTSYAHAERPLSPSTFLRAQLIAELIGAGVKQLDFPAEPYEWERQWTEETRAHQSLICFGCSPKGIGYYLYRQARAFARPNDNVSVSYADPRDHKPELV
jgi:CelD/BcsL family acetyltransferase involved in cellulose biosynthesis